MGPWRIGFTETDKVGWGSVATVVFCRKIHSILFLWWGSCFLGYIPPLCSDLCGTDRNQGIFRYRYRVCKSLTIFCRRTFVCIKPGVRVTNWHISRKKVYRFLSLVREPGRVPYLTILLRQKNTNGLLMRVGVDCILAVIKFGRGNLSFQTG